LAFELLRWCGNSPGFKPGRVAALSPPDDNGRDFLRAREIDSLYLLATGRCEMLQPLYDLAWTHQLSALREVIKELTAANVRTLVFKGGELIARHFGGHSPGLVGDVDLLIPRTGIETAKIVLYSLGFRHGYFDESSGSLRDRDIRNVAEIELHHYELAPFTKLSELEPDPSLAELAKCHNDNPLFMAGSRPIVVVEIDLHHNVAADIEPEMFFDRAVPSVHSGAETLSAADHVWLNLSSYYNEVALHDKRSLRPLAYTIPEISSSALDWDVVEQMSIELSLGPTLYYYLALFNELVPQRIPARTLEAIRVATKSGVRDWGWQLSKIFDFHERFPSYAFGLGETETAGQF